MKSALIYHNVGIENVSMKVVIRHQYCYYPAAITACNAFPHFRSQRLDILGAQVPISLYCTTIIQMKQIWLMTLVAFELMENFPINHSIIQRSKQKQ